MSTISLRPEMGYWRHQNCDSYVEQTAFSVWSEGLHQCYGLQPQYGSSSSFIILCRGWVFRLVFTGTDSFCTRIMLSNLAHPYPAKTRTAEQSCRPRLNAHTYICFNNKSALQMRAWLVGAEAVLASGNGTGTGTGSAPQEALLRLHPSHAPLPGRAFTRTAQGCICLFMRPVTQPEDASGGGAGELDSSHLHGHTCMATHIGLPSMPHRPA